MQAKRKMRVSLPAVERLIILAAKMSEQNGAETKRLAEELGVSAKTVQRDRDFLRDRLHLEVKVRKVILDKSNPYYWAYRWTTNAHDALPIIESLNRFA